MEALVEFHNNIMYYLVAILLSVGLIQGAIIKNYDAPKPHAFTNLPLQSSVIPHI